MRSVGIFGLVLGMAVLAGPAALADAPKVRSRNSLSGVREVNHFATQAQFARMMPLGYKVDVSGGPGPVIYNTDGCDMLDYPVGAEAKKRNMFVNPGSEGTRCHQMAQMVAFEAPMQMLSDSPAKYERNMECYAFMAATLAVWQETVGLGGCPKSYAAVARRAKDGSWYAAALNNREARDFVLDTSFLGPGEWKAEVFRDAAESDTQPMRYVHERDRVVRAGEKLSFRLSPGGGTVVRFMR